MRIKNATLLDRSLEILGSKWTLKIISILLKNNLRFNEIQRSCDICPRTLSLRLDELENNGIVTKIISDGTTLKAEYSLTKKGKSLKKVLSAISDWSMVE